VRSTVLNLGPIQGVFLHSVGGFAAGSFYAPLKKIRRWAWESYWLAMGLAAWVMAPWIAALISTPHLAHVLCGSPPRRIALAYMFGVLWGIGGLTFGLTMRYLGMALGMAVALGFCAVFGTLIPPIVEGQIVDLVRTTSGLTIAGGIAVCIVGICICGRAGMRRDAELNTAKKSDAVPEFALFKGFLVATVAGILSACFAFALAVGEPIAETSTALGTRELYSNNAVLVVILAGGFTTNVIWCVALNVRNRTYTDYVTGPLPGQLFNYAMAAIGGVIWYFQFFFYGMGKTKLGGTYDFSSWSLHMSFIIVFSNLWGLYFREWRGSSLRTKAMVWIGILTLVASSIVIGCGNYLAGD